ncbi:zinc finger domain-containing protein [Glutamicibacter sp. MNS18]
MDGKSGSGGLFRAICALAGHPCRRCGTSIERKNFMNRSSHFCPVCQRKR